MAKHFIVERGETTVVDSEPKSKPTQEDIQAVIKADGFDDLRTKALLSSDYESERSSALKDVEVQILLIKERQAQRLPTTLMKPFEDRVLILPDKPINMTKGGLYVPDTAQEKELPEAGVVVAVGPGRMINGTFVAVTIKPGDRVFFGKYAGTELEDKRNKQKYLCMRFADVFCME